MHLLVKVTSLLVCLPAVSSFKIKIYSCKTGDGFDGYCRPKEYCYGVNSSLSRSTCEEQSICCPKRKVSEEMCNKYSEAVFSASAVVNMNGHSKDKQDECYIKGTPLIVGGEKAGDREFPHMAALGFGKTINDISWMCGGSLISDRFILTAAHCLDNHHFGRPKFVRLGTINLESKKHLTIPIEKLIIHPKYSNKYKKSDIALIKLSSNVKFSSYVRPACMDFSGEIRDSTGIASGFGVTEDGQVKGSPLLMKVQLDLIEKKVCVNAFKRVLPGGLEDSIICAGVLSGGKDTCQGDSGGPLMTIRRKPYCMYNIMGVTSFGRSCGYAYSPAIYTRVFSFIPWIESIVWPNRD